MKVAGGLSPLAARVAIGEVDLDTGERAGRLPYRFRHGLLAPAEMSSQGHQHMLPAGNEGHLRHIL
jgi:hypothetical protein